ncbi:MAG: SUMF1/EgtB/PvdO family nonheme iron enzyme [Planctomycetes bacterium]|nr:SUMF1/EgtB/PvdO family nonheme iron enzyme [Planctomycetota bacterium]
MEAGDSLEAIRRLISGKPASEAPEVGGYSTSELLGKGGMGAVYLARDLLLDREVALKVVLDPRDKNLLARFLAEVRVTAGLSHPGIIRVHDLGLDALGRPYFTMKRIRGEPWSKVLKKETLRERLDVFQKVAEAVAHAHSRGVVHRDLKPANVLVGEYGEVVVADWGLAGVRGSGFGVREEEKTAGAQNEDVRLTRAGGVMGTPGYAAPEQVAGDLDRIGPASDVYALGAILYECLAGEPAYAPGPAIQVISAQQQGRRTPLPRSTPRELAGIARKALEEEPRRRYESVGALLADIERWRNGFPVLAAPDPWTRRALKLFRRHPVVVAVVASLALASVATGAAVWVRADQAAARERSKAADRLEAIAEASGRGRAALERARAHLALSTPEPAKASDEISVARAAFQEAREGVERLPAAERTPEAQKSAEEAAGGLARAELLDIEREYVALSSPRLHPKTPWYRLDGSVYETVVDRVEAARTKGLAAEPELARLERLALGTGPLRIRTDPPDARVRIYRLPVNELDPQEANFVKEIPGDGRTIELDAGGYLLVFEHPDRAPCRLPVYLLRTNPEGRELVVPLLGPDEIPPGFVYIPPGPYLFGERGEYRYDPAEHPETGGYLVAECELSWGEWLPYVEANPEAYRPEILYADGSKKPLQQEVEKAQGAAWRDYPLSGLSPLDLEAYVKWLSDEDPRFEYALPTEGQWERAARGADGREYPWGDDWDGEKANHQDHHPVFYAARVFETVRGGEHGTKSRSVFGLLHAAGNVYEWTSTSGGEQLRVVRGGSAGSPGSYCRCWFAARDVHVTRSAHCGARLVAAARTR